MSLLDELVSILSSNSKELLESFIEKNVGSILPDCDYTFKQNGDVLVDYNISIDTLKCDNCNNFLAKGFNIIGFSIREEPKEMSELRCLTCKNLLYIKCENCKEKCKHIGFDRALECGNKYYFQPNYDISEDSYIEECFDNEYEIIELPPSLIKHSQKINFYTGFLNQNYATDNKSKDKIDYICIFGEEGGYNVYFSCEKCKKTFIVNDK